MDTVETQAFRDLEESHRGPSSKLTGARRYLHTFAVLAVAHAEPAKLGAGEPLVDGERTVVLRASQRFAVGRQWLCAASTVLCRGVRRVSATVVGIALLAACGTSPAMSFDAAADVTQRADSHIDAQAFDATADDSRSTPIDALVADASQHADSRTDDSAAGDTTIDGSQSFDSGNDTMRRPRGPCPIDRQAASGSPCALEGQECGSSCCSDVIRCVGSVWTRFPSPEQCLRCDQFLCGTGTCVELIEACEPTLGSFECVPLP